MADSRFDTMELKELKKMLNSVEPTGSEEFDLDAIIAEVNGEAEALKEEKEQAQEIGKAVADSIEKFNAPEETKRPQEEKSKHQQQSRWVALREEMAATAEKRAEARRQKQEEEKHRQEEYEEQEAKRPQFVFMEAKLGEAKQEEMRAQAVEASGSAVEKNAEELAEQVAIAEAERRARRKVHKAETIRPIEVKAESREENSLNTRSMKLEKEQKYQFHITAAPLGQKKKPAQAHNGQLVPASDKSTVFDRIEETKQNPEKAAERAEKQEAIHKRQALEKELDQHKEFLAAKEAQMHAEEQAKEQNIRKEAIDKRRALEEELQKKNEQDVNRKVSDAGTVKTDPEPDVRIFHPKKKLTDQKIQILRMEDPEMEPEKQKVQLEEKLKHSEQKTESRRKRFKFKKLKEKPQSSISEEHGKEAGQTEEDNHSTGASIQQGRDEIGDISKLDQAEFQEEEPAARDPRRATKTCGKRAKSLCLRSRLVFLLFLGAAYLTMGSVLKLPIPSKISYTSSPSLFLLLLVIFEIVSMLLALDIVGIGLYNLFSGKPDFLSAVSCAMTGSLVHCIVMIIVPSLLGSMPFTAVHIAILFTAMKAEQYQFSGKQSIYKVAALSESPVGVYCHKEGKKKRYITVKFRAQEMETFLKDIEKPDTYERISRFYAPAVIIICIVLAFIVSFATGDKERFFWAYSALISMALPFGLISAFGLPYKYVCRKLMREGVAIAGVRTAQLLKRSKQVVLTDGDLFPAGTIEIEGLKVFGRYTAERVLSYATAVIGGSGSSTYKIFAETLRERYGTPVRAVNVLQYESGGLSADIQGDSVLVGGAAFVMRMGVRIREGRNIRNGIFVVVNNEVAGIFAMKYHPCAQSYAGVHTLIRNHKIPVLATRDFNMNPILVEKSFDLKRGIVDYPELSHRSMMSDRNYVEKDILCAIMSRDDLSPYSDCIQAAGKLSQAVSSNLLLGLIAGILGIVIMFFLTFSDAVLSATPLNVLIYLFLWNIPVMFISHNAKNPY